MAVTMLMAALISIAFLFFFIYELLGVLNVRYFRHVHAM